MFFEYRALGLLVVTEAGDERNEARFRFVAFQFHRWTEQQRNQWANATNVGQQRGLANRQIPGRRISLIDGGRNDIFVRRILQSG